MHVPGVCKCKSVCVHVCVEKVHSSCVCLPPGDLPVSSAATMVRAKSFFVAVFSLSWLVNVSGGHSQSARYKVYKAEN